MKQKNNTFFLNPKKDKKDKIEIEIGDSKQPDFKPQFKFMRWDNEVNFSIRAQEHPDATVEEKNGVIKYKTPKYEIHQYEKPEIGEDGGYEFEWYLPQKPDSNILTATIQTKGLDFYYQPELTQEEINDGASRPDNVVGSYAVYHKTKGGMNDANGMEYKTGKAFHIYRPKAKDANGNDTWGELNIDEQNELLTVTVDQNWLDTAIYPVVVDPTFGYNTIGGTTLTGLSNASFDTAQMVAQYTAVTGDNITQYFVYLDPTAGSTGKVQFSAYSVSSGLPSSRLEAAIDTGVVTGTDVAQWYSTSTVSQTLTNAVIYCIGESFGQLGTVVVTSYYDAGSAPGRHISNHTNLPASWSGTTTDSGRHYSIYATYTASASGGRTAVSTRNSAGSRTLSGARTAVTSRTSV